MSIWIIAAIITQLFVILAIAVVWIRQVRPPKEDQRLSRGLQLLQSKIAVLEDLSDRTDMQVQQLAQILDERAKILQTKMIQAEQTIYKIDQTVAKSLDAADICQEKIPREELIERQQKSKYVLAAQLANEGYTLEKILTEVDLPRNEVEFIMKVNKENLTFDPALLPYWARPQPQQQQGQTQPTSSLYAQAQQQPEPQYGRGQQAQQSQYNSAQQATQQSQSQQMHRYQSAVDSQSAGLESSMVDRVFQTKAPDLSSLNRTQAEFKKTVREVEAFEREEAARLRQMDERAQAIQLRAAQLKQGFVQGAGDILKTSSDLIKSSTQSLGRNLGSQSLNQGEPVVRKVQFPKIYLDK